MPRRWVVRLIQIIARPGGRRSRSFQLSLPRVFGSLLFALALAAVALTATQAHPLSHSVTSASNRATTAGLAQINYENAHFMRVRRSGKHVVVGQDPTRIEIPSIGVNSPVIQTRLVGGTDWQVADWAAGQMQGSPNPGTCTTWDKQHDCATALAAHDDIKGEIFKRIIDLKKGDKVLLFTRRTVFTYKVNAKYVVSPYDSTDLFSSVKSVALVTCTPYWVDTSRLIVTAALTKERARHKA